MNQENTEVLNSETNPALHHKKVLIVDDDRDLLFSLGAFLEQSGWEVETAVDGNMAIKRLLTRVSQPDVILLDYEMPVENGICFWNELNDHPELCYIPTIMMSGTTIPVKDIPGIKSVLSKPINSSELLKLMNSSIHH